ncbi:hypothetical protein AMS68_003335 [Peltaster fructicola]|uniref:Very long-chain fatty acid transport protein n=1 Tax=Peltaster fructicola TaxID=286661 RepID=A0A6H0XT71_9PEZI|nr:hypothetical protein AMS68_003335 [Peltaster fructicola]
MAAIPLSLAIPAATAAATYLNGKYSIANDIFTLGAMLSLLRIGPSLEKKDRVNLFYAFEDLALAPSSANRPFLILPPDAAKPNQRTQWTYAEAHQEVLKHAAWLKNKYDVKRNEVVGMDITNKPDFVWFWFALWSLGAAPAFINTNLRGKAFIHCAKLSTARVMLVDSEIAEVLDQETVEALGADEKGRVIEPLLLTPEILQEIASQVPYRAPNSVRSGTTVKDTAMLIYTSGTTGLPKAAAVGWNKPNAGFILFPRVLGLKSTDRFYTAMPLYHSAASILCVCQCLGAGAAFVLGAKFSPRTFMKNVTETESTVMQYIGELCRYLVAAPPGPYDKKHKLRAAFGNGMRPDVWQVFKDRFNIDEIVEFYAATEGPAVTLNHSRNTFYRGAIGKTGPIAKFAARNLQTLVKYDQDAEAPIRGADGFCIRTGPNEPGELIMALDPNNMEERFQGYVGNSKATESKILRNVFSKGDAFFRTGDLLKIDEEYRWWFVDRIGDTYRWKSENVSTAEVSEALGSHPAVQEANVYGVELPGHDGRCGCAAMIMKENKPLDAALRLSIAEHVKARLPKYAVPLFFRMMTQFELTGTVKQTKVQLRNEGVDPSKTGADPVFYLPSLKDGQGYEPFGKKQWDGIVGGSVRL